MPKAGFRAQEFKSKLSSLNFLQGLSHANHNAKPETLNYINPRIPKPRSPLDQHVGFRACADRKQRAQKTQLKNKEYFSTYIGLSILIYGICSIREGEGLNIKDEGTLTCRSLASLLSTHPSSTRRSNANQNKANTTRPSSTKKALNPKP